MNRELLINRMMDQIDQVRRRREPLFTCPLLLVLVHSESPVIKAYSKWIEQSKHFGYVNERTKAIHTKYPDSAYGDKRKMFLEFISQYLGDI